MFHHVKDLQFNARVSKPDPKFARLLLEQFGGPNGELKAAMQYFVQAFAAKQPHPKIYDMLMDIATEEFSHLEIVGATIQMLLKGVNGDLKNAADESEIMVMMDGSQARESLIHEVGMNPEFLINSGGGPTLTNANGVPWNGMYVTANGDPSVDLRSDMAAESRAKIVYEYLKQFTNDPLVKETLDFLMTREIAHFQMFEAALETIQPNFPPGVLQGNPKYSNVYFNLSNGEPVKGPWNEGKSSKLKEEWQYVENPLQHVTETDGLLKRKAEGTERTQQVVAEMDKELSRKKSEEVKKATPSDGPVSWNND